VWWATRPVVGVGQRGVGGKAQRLAGRQQGGKARVLGHAKAPAQGVGAQPIDGQRAQPVIAIFAALAAQQGGGIAGQDGAQRGQQAAVALGFGELAGQLGHQGQQGIQQRGRCSHGDIVSGQSDCN